MNNVIIMETIGNLHMGEIIPTENFKFNVDGELKTMDELWYIERNGLPIPLKDKHGLILFAKFKDYPYYVTVQLLGDDGK